MNELPQQLIASLQGLNGFDEAAFVQAHQNVEQLISVRINMAKVNGPQALPSIGAKIKREVPWCNTGYYLKERPLFTIDPLFHAGAYYVQEASSMFVEQAMRQCVDLQQKINVLDLCAAPGGKSTLIQSLLTADSLLVSNEVIKSRATILAENITKWGAANVVVTNNDPKDFAGLPHFFDCIVLDAPCSGSGLFRKDATAIQEWSINNVALCSQRQQRIIADVWSSLKPGGTLIYSTCSYSMQEDEAIADWLATQFEAESIRLMVNDDWGVVETVSEIKQCYGYRFYPDKVKGEGFFIAAFRKTSAGPHGFTDGRTVKNSPLKDAEKSIVANWLKQPAAFQFLKWQNDVLAIPNAIYSDVQNLQQFLYIKKAGINMGSLIRNELIASHELIMSTAYANLLPSFAVDMDTALNYLRRAEINLVEGSRGWAVLQYQNINLGLVKMLGNRVNNYYPRDWRILNK